MAKFKYPFIVDLKYALKNIILFNFYINTAVLKNYQDIVTMHIFSSGTLLVSTKQLKNMSPTIPMKINPILESKFVEP